MSRRKPATPRQGVPVELNGHVASPAPAEPAQASVERVSIDDLYIDPANVRVHDDRNKSTIRASLARFGAGRSIVLDGNNVIRAGNGTVEQARELGFEEVLVIEPKPNQLVAVRRPDWSPSEGTSYSIGDNTATDQSRNDDAKLAAVLEAVRNEDATLLEATGHTSDEVDLLLKSLADGVLGNGTSAEDPGPQIDRADELQKKWQTATGQLWVIPSKTTPGKEHRLLCGDSTDITSLVLVMGSDKASLVITDPPYGIDLQNHAAGKERSNRSFEIIGDKSQDAGLALLTQCDGLPLVVFASPMKPWPGIWKQFLVWDKGDSVGAGGDPETYWKSSWELVQVKNTGKLNGGRDPSVLAFPVASSDYSNHPTEKPVALIGYLIEKMSQPREVVFDPFVGSGTSICAAEQTGRLARGIEIAPKYISVALERLEGMGLRPVLAGS